ncbi:MAG: phosphatidylglycerol lysyltransferase domain-containing protein [Candidatus Omnitrophota bacterium]
MRLNKISLEDKKIFSWYLALARHELSNYSFENIYIWSGLFDIRWAIIQDSLCVFFKDSLGCFMYLAPLGKDNNKMAVEESFRVMNEFNKNRDISRIENIEEKDLPFYKKLGYDYNKKSCDYLCLRDDLTAMRGDRFKSKRANFNYFLKNHDFQYLPFSPKHKDECLRLYDNWMGGRKAKYENYIYQSMLADSGNSLKLALEKYSSFNFIARVVITGGKIKAFTLGAELNQDTFCILYEICDLSLKGLPQFIFAEFCRELKDYKYINIMDDLGLENLKPVKLSYRPIRLIPSYIILLQQ